MTDSDDAPKGWQDNAAFRWDLTKRGYLTPNGAPTMSHGIYLYMYEAWRDGLATARTFEDYSGRSPEADPAQLTLHELTSVTLAACAALGGETADLSEATLRDLRTAYAKLAAALEILAAVPMPSAKPSKHPPVKTKHKQSDQRKSGRRAPQPHPRRVRG